MAFPPPRFEHVLVTGASAGIGLEFARQLAPRAGVLTLTARREDRLRALAAELTARRAGLTCRVIAEDLAEPGAGRRLAARMADDGAPPLDLLVNNAGFGRHGGFGEFPWEDWRRMLGLNVVALTELLSVFWGQLCAVPGRGAINVASAAGFQPIPEFAVYAATKAYVRSLSLGLAVEAERRGARMLSLCPGPTATEFGDIAQSDFVHAKSGMTAEAVVTLALRAYEAGRREVVTGWQNRAVALLGSRLPLALVLPVAARVARRRTAAAP